jgi:hypothetical protein
MYLLKLQVEDVIPQDPIEEIKSQNISLANQLIYY